MKKTKQFSPNTSLYTIAHCKEFRTFKKYVICPRQLHTIMQVYKIKHLKPFYPLNAEVTANALNVMRSMIQSGHILYENLGGDVGVYNFVIGQNKPFVLIFPGGGYSDECSFVEGFAVAVRLNEIGYNAFIGQYCVGKQAHYPNPQDDAATILSHILKTAKDKYVDNRDYAVCGFSAGGHLAASWGTKSVGYAKYGLPKPAAMMLSYPVISMGDFTHKSSRKMLLSEGENDPDLQKLYSVECQVDGDYPPTFIWQCKNDKVVPFKNSLLMADALSANNVRYELRSVEGTAHGWGIAVGTAAEGWLEKAVALWQHKESIE